MAEKKNNGKTDCKKEDGANEKKTMAKFAVTFPTGIGIFERGKTYEIPEALFTEWEKAQICEKV